MKQNLMDYLPTDLVFVEEEELEPNSSHQWPQERLQSWKQDPKALSSHVPSTDLLLASLYLLNVIMCSIQKQYQSGRST